MKALYCPLLSSKFDVIKPTNKRISNAQANQRRAMTTTMASRWRLMFAGSGKIISFQNLPIIPLIIRFNLLTVEDDLHWNAREFQTEVALTLRALVDEVCSLNSYWFVERESWLLFVAQLHLWKLERHVWIVLKAHLRDDSQLLLSSSRIQSPASSSLALHFFICLSPQYPVKYYMVLYKYVLHYVACIIRAVHWIGHDYLLCKLVTLVSSALRHKLLN